MHSHCRCSLTFGFSSLTSSITAMSPLLFSTQRDPEDTLGSEELLGSRTLPPPTELRQALSSAAPEEEDGCFFNGCRFTFQPPAEGRRRGNELWHIIGRARGACYARQPADPHRPGVCAFSLKVRAEGQANRSVPLSWSPDLRICHQHHPPHITQTNKHIFYN